MRTSLWLLFAMYNIGLAVGIAYEFTADFYNVGIYIDEIFTALLVIFGLPIAVLLNKLSEVVSE